MRSEIGKPCPSLGRGLRGLKLKIKYNKKSLAVGSFIVAILLNLLAGGITEARQDNDQRRFIEVRRRQLDLQSARKQAERTEKLAAQGLVSQNEVDRDRNLVATAQLNYQQAVLALLDLQPRISVRSAVKTQSSDGRKFVRLVLCNLSPTFDDSQFKLLNNFDGADPIPDQLRTRTVNDVFVSLRDSGAPPDPNSGAPPAAAATVSLPYEVHIPQMKYGETKTLDFQLLRDVNVVMVALTYRNQTQESPVQLQHAAGESDIQISSSQSSQEADLGSQATYNLSLERPTVDVRSFQLKVVNMPRQISYSFIDLQSQARLSQINFPAGVTRQTLGLRLFLPERSDSHVQLDRPLEFWVLALDDAAPIQINQDRTYTDEELAAVKSGKVKMVVLPRGVGKIEVVAASLFSEIETGQSVETTFTVRNSGTRRLDNVKLTTDAPLSWRAEIDPNVVPLLESNQESVVGIKILPPPDVTVGDYEIRIKTESSADNRRVQSEDKIYRVSIKARTDLLRTSAMGGGLILLVLTILVFGIKLTKR